LPKVPSSYPLSPRWGERVRVREGKKKLLAIAIIRRASLVKIPSGQGFLIFAETGIGFFLYEKRKYEKRKRLFFHQQDFVVDQVQAVDFSLQDLLFPKDTDNSEVVAIRFNDVHILKDQFLLALFQQVSGRFTHGQKSPLISG
jgi:hypothetical protein